MSPLDPELPPIGEEIHLPGPSRLPIITAVGITLLIIGLTTIKFFTFVGALISIVCIVIWIKQTRRETAELPLEHGEQQ